MEEVDRNDLTSHIVYNKSTAESQKRKVQESSRDCELFEGVRPGAWNDAKSEKNDKPEKPSHDAISPSKCKKHTKKDG